MNVLYSEQSQRTNSSQWLVACFVLLLLAAVAYTTMRSYEQGHLLLAEYFIEIAAIIVIVKQAFSRYTYILTDRELIIDEMSFFRTRRFSVAYDDIDGIYPYNRDFLTNLRYRYKYRKCSTSDDRPMWFLVYSIVKGKKVQFGRVVLKADNEFYEILERFVPNRIRVPEADVVFHATVRADAVKHGEDVKAYYQRLISGEDEDVTSEMSEMQQKESN